MASQRPSTAFSYEFARFGVKMAWACRFGALRRALLSSTYLLYPAGSSLPRHDFLLVALAGDEKLVDNAASRAFAARHSDVRLIEVAGAFHEILMETDDRRAVFWAAFDRMTAEVLDR